MTRAGIALVAILLATAFHPAESSAQSVQGTQLQAFVRTEFYRGLINRAFSGLSPVVFQRCPTLVSGGSRVTIIKPVSFGQDGFPNSGLWRQSFPISGCGNDTVLNFFFYAGADEKINTIIAFPGGTHADLLLQRDAKLYADIGAQAVSKGCKTFVVKDTRFEGFGAPNPPIPDPGPEKGIAHRPWWEKWTLVGCGHTIEVPVDFVPQSKGTQIIQPGGAIER